MSRRRLSDEERALWQGFARAVTPLRRGSSGDEAIAADQKRPAARPNRAVKHDTAKPKTPAALTQFDRRLRQRVARGQVTIDARLDLHGMTQRQAHAALIRFLHQAQTRDAKLVLVVTGKGLGSEPPSARRGRTARDEHRDEDGERGVLRRQVPLWLSLPEFRRFIVSFEEAHVSHGGEGALYLRLRRRSR
jgi:DNA-nicking Smr family endonuclease